MPSPYQSTTPPIAPGATPQRVWYGIHVHLPSVVRAGLAAGVILLILDFAATLIAGTRTPFGPAYITLYGLAGAETQPGTVDGGLLGAALVLHFTLSVSLTLPLAVLIHPWKNRAIAVAVGFVLGVLLYFINFHVFALAMPVLEAARDAFMIVNYAAFGTAAAWLYTRLVPEGW